MSTRALCLTLALLAPAAAQTVPDPAISAAKPKPHRTHVPTAHSPAFDPNLILLDPAHGGSDPGGHITPDLPEKQLTLDLARRLRPLLAAKGFTVVLTREGDPVQQPAPPPDPTDPDAKPVAPPPPAQITLDQRAELANRIRPAACILLHATSAGHGVHLYTSALTPPANSEPAREIPLWDTAQLPALANSIRLAGALSDALTPLHIPLLTGLASIRPIDSMTCPAVLVELAPSGNTPVTDQAYQQRVAEAIVTALEAWRTQAQAILADQAAFAAREAERNAQLAKPSAKTVEKAKPRPKPAPGSLIPNAPAALPRIPQIPQIPRIVAPSSRPAPAPTRTGGPSPTKTGGPSPTRTGGPQ